MIAYLPLSGEITVPSGHTEQESIELDKVGRGEDRIVRLGRRIHLLQDFLREGLSDPMR